MSSLTNDKFYVAPPEPPVSRRPPATEVGVLGWLKHNLFNDLWDTCITLFTTAVVVYFVYDFLTWAIFDAQWEIAFLNTRQLFVGPTFPASEMWRINLAAYIVIFLSLLAVGYWTSIGRGVVILLGVFAALMVVVPAVSQSVSKPMIYYWADATKADQVNFVADEGQKITFTIDPLTDKNEFGVENFAGGYIGNDNSLPNTSWDLFATASQQLAAPNSTIDPSLFDLNLAVQVWDAEGAVIAESDFTGGAEQKTVTLEWEAPADAWYTFAVVRDEENPGTQGYAWLKVDNLEVFISTLSATKTRENKYGAPPVLDCERCNTQVNRTDMRFQGDRTLLQWFSLQLSPFLTGIRAFFFISLIAGAVGYGLGIFFKQGSLKKQAPRLILGLWLAAVPIWYVLIKGIGGDTFPSIKTLDMGGILLTLIITVIPLIASFPLGIGLALGRRSDLPAVSFLCTIFIEVFRGVPLITLLFSGRYIVQYLADFMGDVDIIIRVMIVLTVFTAAYLAEVIRGGLQIVPKGQLEAAQAVGLQGFWIINLIVLPQALRAVIPAILGQFLSLFKDTSLVALIGLFEIVGALRRILGDPLYLDYGREGWIFVFIVFFLLSYAMAEVSRKLEETGSGAVRRNQI